MAISLNLIKRVLHFWREILIVSLAGLCYYMYSQPEIVCPTPLVTTDTKYITKTEKEYIRVTEPGGTITEKVVERAKTANEQKEKTKPAPLPPTVADKPKWSIQGNYDFREKSYQAEIGYRLGNTPFTAVGGYDFKTRAVSAGVRIDW